MATTAERKRFLIRGVGMLAVFAVIFCFLLTPVLHDPDGNAVTGLQYADDVFNEISKGSSYFIPRVTKTAESMDGKMVNVSVKLKADLADAATKVFTTAGATASYADGMFTFQGDLGAVLRQAAKVSDLMYQNKGADVSAMFNGLGYFDVSRSFWHVLQPAVKGLQKQNKLTEANAVDTVVRRGIEPGHNYYSIQAASAAKHPLLLGAMLVFYILFTLWYGFGIFFTFEGIGLAMGGKKKDDGGDKPAANTSVHMGTKVETKDDSAQMW